MVTHSASRFGGPAIAAILLSLVCGISGGGCSDGSVKQPAATQLAHQPNRHHQGPPLTDQECASFVEKIVTSVRTDDIETAKSLIDLSALVETASTGIELSSNEKGEILRGFKDGFTQGGGLFADIRQAISKGGTFDHLRTRTLEGERRATFRLVLSESGGINYLGFPLARRPSGEVLGTDVYVYFSGELMSQTVRRMLLPVVAQEKRGILERLQQGESEFVQHMGKIQRMAEQNRSRQFKEALATYRSLPPALRDQKFAQLMRLQAAQNVDDEEYASALEKIRRDFPNDACADFLSIDAHLIKQQFDQALTSVDRLDKALGGDPYLNVLRTNIYLAKHDVSNAKAVIEKAVAAPNAHRDTYVLLVRVALAENRHDKVRQGLETLLTRFNLDLGNLAENIEFAEFAKSPEHTKWLKYRTEQGK
jgi:hypothetical protein